jgi:hypothetical protein
LQIAGISKHSFSMFLRLTNDISCKHDIACQAFATKKDAT